MPIVIRLSKANFDKITECNKTVIEKELQKIIALGFPTPAHPLTKNIVGVLWIPLDTLATFFAVTVKHLAEFGGVTSSSQIETLADNILTYLQLYAPLPQSIKGVEAWILPPDNSIHIRGRSMSNVYRYPAKGDLYEHGQK